MTTAAIYARISSDPRDTNLGVTRQIKDCRGLAERRGWTVGKVYTDNDVSASNGKQRPQYEAMLAALRSGGQQALICWDIDRLTRSPRELEDIVDLHKFHAVQLASVGGEVDLATEMGRLTARIKGAVAKNESEQLSRRVRRKLDERADAGQPHGKIAYGWKRENTHDHLGRVTGSTDVIDEPAAAAIRDAANRLLAGESLRAISVKLNASQAPMRASGKGWTPEALRDLLMRDRNAGLLVRHGKVIGQGDWPAVYDEGAHNRVVALLTDPSRRTSPANSSAKYLLSGIARCGICGGPMRSLGGRKEQARMSYVCQDHYHLRRARGPIDELVSKLIVGRLSMPDALELFTIADDITATEAREKAEALRATLDRAADSLESGGPDSIDFGQLSRINARLRPQLEAALELARSCSTAPDLSDTVEDVQQGRWAELSLARQRALIDALITVRVLPTSRRGRQDFDPQSIAIAWKAG